MIHFLEPLLPEGLDRDICNGDEDEQALTLRDIVEPLQQPLSVLQKERRVKLASLSLVISDKMQQLESTDRHPATPQKLPMSTQSTLPAAPASAPLLPSASTQCCSWSRPIDILRHRRSYRCRHSRPCLQRPRRHPFFRLFRLFPSLYL